MTRVQHQRSDVLPLTWEPPAAIAMAWVVGAAAVLPLGQGLAFVFTGRPFTWPTGRLPESVLGLLQGRTGVGLPPSATPVPSTIYVVACLAVLEVLLALAIGWLASQWWCALGPGAQKGLALRHEVRDVLGPGHLRKRRRIIRPDLHARRSAGHTGSAPL